VVSSLVCVLWCVALLGSAVIRW